MQTAFKAGHFVNREVAFIYPLEYVRILSRCYVFSCGSVKQDVDMDIKGLEVR